MLSSLRSWRESLTPASSSVDFRESGQISPEEFVAAGDYLCHQFPTWSWAPVDGALLKRDFLPPERQYLVCKDVPCADRAHVLAGQSAAASADEVVDADGYVRADVDRPLSDAQPSAGERSATSAIASVGSKDPDLDDFVLPGEEEEGTTVRTRTYDLFITYDKYYRTPRLWLYGWSEDGVPLTVEQVFEDISGDHVGKTVTMEPFPHSKAGTKMATVHPCKHASVMKVFIDRMSAHRREGETAPSLNIRVDQYLIVFLKFVATITPTIEHESGTFYV